MEKVFALEEPQVGFELHAVDCYFPLILLAMTEPAIYLNILDFRKQITQFTTFLDDYSQNPGFDFA